MVRYTDRAVASFNEALNTYGETKVELQAFNLDNRYKSDVSQLHAMEAALQTKAARCQQDWRLGTTLSRPRCSAEKKFAPTSVELGFQGRLSGSALTTLT